MAPKILLKNGLLLVHESNGDVVPKRADLLVEGNTIAEIGDAIPATGGAQVLDCEGKIVSPGFISTHHHMWQTQLKGRHGNHTLLQYLPPGNHAGAFYSAEDAFWGQLGGAMEAIDAGTTTVVDHSSVNMSADHPPAMIQALATSGLRAVYCQTVPRTLASQQPLAIADDYTLENALTGWCALADLHKAAPLADGRVQLGFAVDNLHLPAAQIQALYAALRARHARVITSHASSGALFGYGRPSAVQLLDQHGLLGPDILLSHANNPREGDAERLAQTNAFVSSTPHTELQMGTTPVALFPEIEPQASLGIDCHSWGASYMPVQMRLLLQHARTVDATRLAAGGQWRRRLHLTVQQAFNLATLGGARSVGMAGQIGQIQVGARADLLVFDTHSPSMLAAAQENPLTAIVMHSSERDVETVMVDGIVRKTGGKLLPVQVAESIGGHRLLAHLDGQTLAWSDVAGHVLESRARLDKQYAGLDWQAAEERIIDGLHSDREAMID